MLPLPSTVAAAAGQTKCELTYSLRGWSAFYKTANGEGVIRCDNGRSMAVAIHVEGGGITFGKTEVKNATGKFTEVAKIDDSSDRMRRLRPRRALSNRLRLRRSRRGRFRTRLLEPVPAGALASPEQSSRLRRRRGR